jgi:glioma pathogenesis-related protein 2
MKKLLLLLLFIPLVCIGQLDDKDKALEVHNFERKSLNLQPLKWSNKLENDSKKYADYLASKDIFRHSKDLRKLKQGENLYSTMYYVIDDNGEKYFFDETNYLFDASVAWLEEKKDYKYARISDGTNTFSKIGHYTQMIWNKSKEVGIAYSKSKSGNIYVVARYFPQGNLTGEYPYLTKGISSSFNSATSNPLK